MEVALCVGTLAVMILLACAQVVLRHLRGVELAGFAFPQPIPWFDNVTRHLVIWIGLLGASLATVEGRHISIEAVPKLLSVRGKRRLDVLLAAGSLLVTGILAILSLIYLVKVQMPHSAPLFEIELLGLKVYRWPFLLIVPLSLSVMCWRFLLRGIAAATLGDASYLRALGEESDLLDVLSPELPAAAQEPKAPEEDAPQQAEAEEREEPDPEPPEPEAESDESTEPGDSNTPQMVEIREQLAEMRKGGLRSTDEIPIYRELADDEDLREPELRRGLPELESADEMEQAIDILMGPTDTSDEITPFRVDVDAEAEFEGSTASTERIPAEPEPLGLEDGPPGPDSEEDPS